jgi:hypothetical protein
VTADFLGRTIGKRCPNPETLKVSVSQGKELSPLSKANFDKSET